MTRSRRPFEVAGWGIGAVLVSAWLALVEVFWLPLRIGGFVVPLSVLAAVIGNVLLVGQAHRLSGSRAVAVAPAITWLVVVIAAMMRRPEGDLILVGTGTAGVTNLVFLLLGVMAAAVAVGGALAGPPRRVVIPAAAPDRLPDRAGSGNGGAR